MRNKVLRLAGAAGAALVLAGCTVTVSGAAGPVPGQGAVKKPIDTCALLDQAAVVAAGFKYPGKPEKIGQENGDPPDCGYEVPDDADKTGSLLVGWSVTQNMDDFLAGAVPQGAPQQLGGLSWQAYGSIDKDSCDLYTKLGPKSFATLSISITNDRDESCKRSTFLAPYLAAKLPGGQPNPPPPPPPSSSGPPAPSGPLVSLDPCSTLKADQAAQLKMQFPGAPDKGTTESPNTVYCDWTPTGGVPQPGQNGQKSFEVWVAPDFPADKWPLIGDGVPPTEQVDAGGKTWQVFANVGNDRVSCEAVLKVTDTSSVRLVSGYIGDETKMCDVLKQGIPLVTANLPS